MNLIASEFDAAPEAVFSSEPSRTVRGGLIVIGGVEILREEGEGNVDKLRKGSIFV